MQFANRDADGNQNLKYFANFVRSIAPACMSAAAGAFVATLTWNCSSYLNAFEQIYNEV